jgi:putative membrane protein
MPALAAVFALLAAALHVAIFVMESVLWTRPAVYRRFGLASVDEAQATKSMAYNQGFYNLFLAVGIVVGVAVGGDVGTALVVFCCASIVAAAAVLLTTGLSYLRAAVTQALFAVIALVLFAVL